VEGAALTMGVKADCEMKLHHGEELQNELRCKEDFMSGFLERVCAV
jgi:hypothetical protein